MTSVSVPPQDAAAFETALATSPTQIADLEAFRLLLKAWTAQMNLVGPSALAEFWPRHAYDSAQLLAFAPDALTWADLGAGAGFPGLVLAILLKGRPGAHVHLVESMAKRCRFLSEVVRTLDLPVSVHNVRAEQLRIKVDIVTARACAPLVRLLGYAEPYLTMGAMGLFLKGQDVVSELTDASKCWEFEAELLPSSSHATGRVLQVKGLARVRAV